MYTNFIRTQLPAGELLAQLAEEAAELAQAALKLRRAMDGGNPAACGVGTAQANLREELADVLVCVKVLGYNTDTDLEDITNIQAEKMSRWASRLAAREGDRWK